jgi:hypothetical protein
MNCPKCAADITDTFEPDDPSVGICAGWYCDACDLGIGEHEYPREPTGGDVPITFLRTDDSLKVGDDVYVKQPQRFSPGCTCIVGPIQQISGDRYLIAASIGRVGGGFEAVMNFDCSDIARRLGTPLSQIATQPHQKGYDEWLRISRSWGFW